MKKAKREGDLDLLVPDSGRTWSIIYQEIRSIPPGTIERGDVFIVRNATEPGVMFMQAIRPAVNGHNGWHLEALELA